MRGGGLANGGSGRRGFGVGITTRSRREARRSTGEGDDVVVVPAAVVVAVAVVVAWFLETAGGFCGSGCALH